jgi:hypothetical protein
MFIERQEKKKKTLPEAAPANVVLAQVLEVRRLLDQTIHLPIHRQFLVGLEVPTSQLFLDTGQHLKGTRILYFAGLGVVGGNGVGSMATTHKRRDWMFSVANDGLAAFRWERWLRWRVALAETPGQKRVMDELKRC